MNTRQIRHIKDDVWDKIGNTVRHAKDKLNNQQLNTFIHVPVCIGFKEGKDSLLPEEFALMNQELVNSGLNYAFYLYPNPDNNVAVTAWERANPRLIDSLKQSGKLFYVDAWRAEQGKTQREQAKEAYSRVYSGNKHASTMDVLLGDDVQKYLRGEKRTPEKAVSAKQHVKDECLDVLARATKKDEPVKTVNILLYPGKLYSSMTNVLQLLDELGYVKESLHHVTATLVPSIKNEKLTPPPAMQSQRGGTRKSPGKSSPADASTPPSPPRETMSDEKGLDPVVRAMTEKAIAEGPEYAAKFMAEYNAAQMQRLALEQKQASELKKRLAALQDEQDRNVNQQPPTPASTPVTVPKRSSATWPSKNSPQSPSPEPNDSPVGESPLEKQSLLLTAPAAKGFGQNGLFNSGDKSRYALSEQHALPQSKKIANNNSPVTGSNSARPSIRPLSRSQ